MAQFHQKRDGISYFVTVLFLCCIRQNSQRADIISQSCVLLLNAMLELSGTLPIFSFLVFLVQHTCVLRLRVQLNSLGVALRTYSTVAFDFPLKQYKSDVFLYTFSLQIACRCFGDAKRMVPCEDIMMETLCRVLC